MFDARAGIAFAAVLAVGCGKPATQAAMADLDGRTLYATNGCGTCHGQRGYGDGPVGKTLKPPPRDFRDGAAFKNGADRDAIARTIETGLTRDGGQMQAYGHLTLEERRRLADFVITLRQFTGDRTQ